MRLILKPLARCAVPDLGYLRDQIRSDVRRYMVSLSNAGCAAVDVAELVGVSRSTLYRWRAGDELPNLVQLELLKLLAAQVTSVRKAAK